MIHFFKNGFLLLFANLLGFWGKVFASETTEEDKMKGMFSYYKTYFFLFLFYLLSQQKNITFPTFLLFGSYENVFICAWSVQYSKYWTTKSLQVIQNVTLSVHEVYNTVNTEPQKAYRWSKMSMLTVKSWKTIYKITVSSDKEIKLNSNSKYFTKFNFYTYRKDSI